MATLAVDELMLREPRLLVPLMVPLGPLKLASNPIAAKVSHLVIPGRRLHYAKNAWGAPVYVDVSISGTEFGPAGRAAAASGDYIETPAFNLVKSGADNSLSLAMFGNPIPGGVRHDVYNQSNPSTPYQQINLACNSTRAGIQGSGEISAWDYDGGFKESVQANDVAVGLPITVVATLPKDGSTAPTIYVNGVNKTTSAAANATVVDPSAFPIWVCQSNLGPFWLFITFSPALTEAERIAWCADPFCIVEPA